LQAIGTVETSGGQTVHVWYHSGTSMPDKKRWSSTVMGWFIVHDPAAAGSAEDAGHGPAGDGDDAQSAAGTPPPSQLKVFSSAPPDAPGGNVDFEKVFDAAGIGTEERERVTRTQQLLESLPPGTDDTVKKQIVMASLKAFGVPIEKIIESGAEEIQALEAYIRAGAADTEKVAADGAERIKHYEEEIVKLRTVKQQRVAEQNAVIQSCNGRKLDVQKVLEFFGQEAVARVVRESPKLHEPSS
jgi:hypothetical protein